jgi:8-oxo-dGTP pyrophosphatase MutT (NUDIX family)
VPDATEPPQPPTDPVVTAWPGFDRERRSVRVVLLDDDGRLLLFDTHDPAMPETGAWWELPGGGMKLAESVLQTVVREIAEETGLLVPPAGVGTARWSRDVTYARRHVRTLQHEVVVTARVPGSQPAVRGDGRTPHERDEYRGHRWWTVTEVTASSQRFFPASLPRHLSGFLSGETIAEPFEHWN